MFLPRLFYFLNFSVNQPRQGERVGRKSKIMSKSLKGFTEAEVFDLYKYLCIYENKIRILKNLTEVYRKYPKLKDLECIMNQFVLNYATDDMMHAVGLFVPKGVVYCTNTKSSKAFNFLYHLRNSIAHGQIEKDNQYVLLIDYKLEKSKGGKREKVYSGRGNLNSSVVFQIVKIINEEVGL